MGNVNLPAVFLGALAFFIVTMTWYGALFGRAWRKEVRLAPELDETVNTPLIFGLVFAFELLVALMLGHQYARTDPSPRAMMMIAVGYGATLMVPALGINYLFQRVSGKLFFIDAGHLILGMAAMGGVFLALR